MFLAKNSGFTKQFTGQKIIAGWKLSENTNDTNLDDKLQAWEDEYAKSGTNIGKYLRNKMSSRVLQLVTDRQDSHPLPPCHYSPHSSASTQEAFANRLAVSIATESCEMTPGSQSVDTAISHATFDELDEAPVSLIKETGHGRRKKRTRHATTNPKRTYEKSCGNFYQVFPLNLVAVLFI